MYESPREGVACLAGGAVRRVVSCAVRSRRARVALVVWATQGACAAYDRNSSIITLNYQGVLPGSGTPSAPPPRPAASAAPARRAVSEAPPPAVHYEAISERALIMLGRDCEARVELGHRCYVASVESRCADLRDMMVEVARQASVSAVEQTRIGAMCASVCERRHGGSEWSDVGRELALTCGDG